MSRILTHLISASLIGGGVWVWAFAGHTLVTNSELNVPLNILGINRSPYGEVLAMAMQGPIDTYFLGGMGAGFSRYKAGDSRKEAAEKIVTLTKSNPSFERRFKDFLSTLNQYSEVSTNPKALGDAHKRYLRRQVEDKLRFAYQLDPSHYGNYNSLHFFLTEGLSTRPQLTHSAAKLAQDTIEYCLKQENDPRPALTAAAAATNILHLMLDDQHNEVPKFNTTQMRQCLNLLDLCLARYQTIARQWDESEKWELLSQQRITECQDRALFIGKIRDAAEKTIVRLEGKIKAS